MYQIQPLGNSLNNLLSKEKIDCPEEQQEFASNPELIIDVLLTELTAWQQHLSGLLTLSFRTFIYYKGPYLMEQDLKYLATKTDELYFDIVIEVPAVFPFPRNSYIGKTSIETLAFYRREGSAHYRLVFDAP